MVKKDIEIQPGFEPGSALALEQRIDDIYP